MTTTEEQDVRDTLGNAGHPLTRREVALASGVPHGSVRVIVARMLESGEVTEDDSRLTMVNEGAAPPEGGSRVRSRTGQHDEVVLEAVREHAGDSGITISKVSQLVNLRRRVVENTLYRLEEKRGELISVGRPRRYRPRAGAAEKSVGL